MIEAIYISTTKKGNQSQLDTAELEKGKGITGDRRFGQSDEPGTNVTYIEAE